MEVNQPEVPPIRVSALIVTHNSIEPLRRCLRALERSQARETFEVLVVDNGSRDGCEDIDLEFPDVTMLRLPRHFGLTKARNIGIRTAKGEHLLLLTAQVEVEPTTVTALSARLEEEPAALAVCPLLVGSDGEPVSELRKLPDATTLSRHWRTGLPLERKAEDVSDRVPVELHDGRALLCRRDTIRGINYYDERFGEYWGDCDLAHQIRRAGKKILLLGDVRATVQPAGPVLVEDPRRRAAFDADRAVGAAAYAGKHFGFLSGLGLRVKIALRALLAGLTFQDSGYQFGLFQRVVSGQKIDGNDPTL